VSRSGAGARMFQWTERAAGALHGSRARHLQGPVQVHPTVRWGDATVSSGPPAAGPVVQLAVGQFRPAHTRRRIRRGRTRPATSPAAWFGHGARCRSRCADPGALGGQVLDARQRRMGRRPLLGELAQLVASRWAVAGRTARAVAHGGPGAECSSSTAGSSGRIGHSRRAASGLSVTPAAAAPAAYVAYTTSLGTGVAASTRAGRPRPPPGRTAGPAGRTRRGPLGEPGTRSSNVGFPDRSARSHAVDEHPATRAATLSRAPTGYPARCRCGPLREALAPPARATPRTEWCRAGRPARAARPAPGAAAPR